MMEERLKTSPLEPCSVEQQNLDSRAIFQNAVILDYKPQPPYRKLVNEIIRKNYAL